MVEAEGRRQHNEELAVAAVHVLGAGHGGDAAQVRQVIELGLKVRERRIAAAGTGRVATLGHEAGNDAMEGCPVVEAGAHQRLDAADMVGCEVGAQLDDDRAAVRQLNVEAVGRIGGDRGRRDQAGCRRGRNRLPRGLGGHQGQRNKRQCDQ
jgi:hypothetical protein